MEGKIPVTASVSIGTMNGRHKYEFTAERDKFENENTKWELSMTHTNEADIQSVKTVVEQRDLREFCKTILRLMGD